MYSPIKRCGRRWRNTSPIIPPTAKHSKTLWSPLPALVELSGMKGKISVGTELMSPVAIAASRHACSMGLLSMDTPPAANTLGQRIRSGSLLSVVAVAKCSSATFPILLAIAALGSQWAAYMVPSSKVRGGWPPGRQTHKPNKQIKRLHGATMGIRIMRLVTLWLVASAETFHVHGASAAMPGAKGVQGREATKGVSKKQQRAAAAAAKEVCSVGDSPATCRELTAKYRGGGECDCLTYDFDLPSVSVTHAAESIFS